MTLEKTLLKTIIEYEELLKSGTVSHEAILSIHQRMKPLRNRIDYIDESPNLVREYRILHPNARIIRREHSTNGMRDVVPSVDEVHDGEIEVSYLWDNQRVKGVYLFALNFFFPRANDDGEWWYQAEGHHSDFGYNRTEFGYMHVLRADGKGSFWSSEVMKLDSDTAGEDFSEELRIINEKEARKMKLDLWDTCLNDEAISGLTISRISLEKGDLTAFFNHIGYKLLDGLYKDAD